MKGLARSWVGTEEPGRASTQAPGSRTGQQPPPGTTELHGQPRPCLGPSWLLLPRPCPSLKMHLMSCLTSSAPHLLHRPDGSQIPPWLLTVPL